MVTDVGTLGDRSFDDSVYAGLKAAQARFGAEIEALESKSAADYQPNLSELANEDYSEIFAIGFLTGKVVDAVVGDPNVLSIAFREQEGSFLAGALAAMRRGCARLRRALGTAVRPATRRHSK